MKPEVEITALSNTLHTETGNTYIQILSCSSLRGLTALIEHIKTEVMGSK